ncbi:hypothetical protein ITP53_31230 [Nonomuraea sp. K274]|uniref:Uncharacterized protein n=1 Tax=Nonomuraea cypriaca TaxID=1187855 RepID=A0A931AHA6_9ACTN|nr:hypothetical protein [Nonomuraea cypriaca]MBF8190120.1 hypothetical protein [Nonomuraea cypriaca]
MPDPQAEPRRRCASPFCRKTLPAGSTGRRRYCSGACRQAAWRIDNPIAVPRPVRPSQHELAALEDDVRRRAAHLAACAQHAATAPTGSGKQTAALRSLPDLVEGLLAAHVTASRAAGHTWEQVGQALALHPDTARRRFGQPQTDADVDVDRGADRPQATPAPVEDRQALAETSGEGLAGQSASAIPPAAQQAQPPAEAAAEEAWTIPPTPASDLYLAQLGGENCLLLVDGDRMGWLHAAPEGWQVYGRDGRLVSTLPADDAHGYGVVVGLTSPAPRRPRWASSTPTARG